MQPWRMDNGGDVGNTNLSTDITLSFIGLIIRQYLNLEEI